MLDVFGTQSSRFVNPYIISWKCSRCGCGFSLKEPWNQEQRRLVWCDRCFRQKRPKVDWSREGF